MKRNIQGFVGSPDHKPRYQQLSQETPPMNRMAFQRLSSEAVKIDSGFINCTNAVIYVKTREAPLRVAPFSPSNLDRMSIPVDWNGSLIHYRTTTMMRRHAEDLLQELIDDGFDHPSPFDTDDIHSFYVKLLAACDQPGPNVVILEYYACKPTSAVEYVHSLDALVSTGKIKRSHPFSSVKMTHDFFKELDNSEVSAYAAIDIIDNRIGKAGANPTATMYTWCYGQIVPVRPRCDEHKEDGVYVSYFAPSFDQRGAPIRAPDGSIATVRFVKRLELSELTETNGFFLSEQHALNDSYRDAKMVARNRGLEEENVRLRANNDAEIARLKLELEKTKQAAMEAELQHAASMRELEERKVAKDHAHTEKIQDSKETNEVWKTITLVVTSLISVGMLVLKIFF